MERPHGRSESATFGKVFLQISKKSGCLLRPLGIYMHDYSIHGISCIVKGRSGFCRSGFPGKGLVRPRQARQLRDLAPVGPKK